MKNYLSKNEQLFCLTLTACLNLIELKLDNKWYGSRNERKYLKYCRTYSEKYLRAIYDRIGPEEYKRLEKFNSQYNLKAFPQNSKELERVSMDKDSMMDLIEFAVEGKCNCCEAEDPGECRLRQSLTNAFVPTLNDGDGCEYYVGG